MYRQGDVLLIPERASEVGDAAPVAREGGRIVLAYGEVTGHAHAIADVGATLLRREIQPRDRVGRRFEQSEAVFLDVEQTVRLRHEEHAPITIPPGTYRVVRQREHQPSSSSGVTD